MQNLYKAGHIMEYIMRDQQRRKRYILIFLAAFLISANVISISIWGFHLDLSSLLFLIIVPILIYWGVRGQSKRSSTEIKVYSITTGIAGGVFGLLLIIGAIYVTPSVLSFAATTDITTSAIFGTPLIILYSIGILLVYKAAKAIKSIRESAK